MMKHRKEIKKTISKIKAKARLKRIITMLPIAGTAAGIYFEESEFQDQLTRWDVQGRCHPDARRGCWKPPQCHFPSQTGKWSCGARTHLRQDADALHPNPARGQGNGWDDALRFESGKDCVQGQVRRWARRVSKEYAKACFRIFWRMKWKFRLRSKQFAAIAKSSAARAWCESSVPTRVTNSVKADLSPH